MKKFLDCTMICTMATTMVLSSLNVKVLAVENSINETNIEEAARVSYYSFDDLNADDAWGNRNGTVKGATFVEGKSGKAASVTESKNIVVSGTSKIGENDPWTVSYWVKSTADLVNRASVMMDTAKDFSFDLKMASNRDAGFHVGKRDGDVLTYQYNFQPNVWYNVTWTQSKQDGLSMYVNGRLVKNNVWTKTHKTLAPIDIIGSTGFIGLIDEVKVYNRVLTEAEINKALLTKGFNINEHNKTIFIEEKYQIEANLLTDSENDIITYESSNPEVASVDNQGVVTGLKRGTTNITLKAEGYTDTIKITVDKKINIKNVLPHYMLSKEYLSDIEKSPGGNRQYLGQPDMVRTSTGRLITAYPAGHGKGPIIMKISDDDGEYCFTIAEDWAQSPKSGDTGYTGLVVLEDGTFIMDSYGHWDKEFSEKWGWGNVRTDLCYIKQAKFKLGNIENDNNLVSRENLDALISQVKDVDENLYTSESFATFKLALEKAESISSDKVSQQVEVDAAEKTLKEAFDKLVEENTKSKEENNKSNLKSEDIPLNSEDTSLKSNDTSIKSIITSNIKTGDNIALSLWILAVSVSFIGLAILLIRKIKIKNNTI